MNRITGADRRYLRGLANTRKSVVQVGDAGFTPAIVRATDAALRAHELVKVRINGARDEREAIAHRLADETKSELAGTIGHVAILYRPASDPDERVIELPSERS